MDEHPDFAQREAPLPVLVSPPPVRVADAVKPTQVGLDGVRVVAEQDEQRG